MLNENPVAVMEDRASIAPAPEPEPQTVGESMAHMSPCQIWTRAVFTEAAIIAFFVGLVHGVKSAISPSFFSAVPWRLALWASFGVYLSLVPLVMSYVDLFLPRVPVAAMEKLWEVGGEAVGGGALNLMVSGVLAFQVRDSRVLAGCTAVVATCAVGLVAFWGWLAGRYGGDLLDPAATEASPRIGGSSELAARQPSVARPPI